MKKFIILVFIFIFTQAVFASEKQYLFVIRNITPEQTIDIINKKFINENIENFKVDKYNNIIFSNKDKFYLKSYQQQFNTEVFLITTSKSNNEKEFILNLPAKTFLIEDKYSIENYKKDFIYYTKQNNIIFAHHKQSKNLSSYKDYNPYNKNLKNKKIGKITEECKNIKIIRYKLEPKVKVKKYADEYEYIICNNTGKDVIINKVASENFIGLTQIASYLSIPDFKMFVPLYGIIYGIQCDLEKNRFTRPHPINEIIKANEKMRILALTKKDDSPETDFYFTIDDNQVKYTFYKNEDNQL